MQILQPTTKQKGLKCCWNKLQMYMAIKTMKIWFSEDISVSSTANRQNEYLFKKRNCYNKHIMVSEFISKIRKGLLLFMEEGATVNGNYYLEMLKKHLYVIRRLSGGWKFIIQHIDLLILATTNHLIMKFGTWWKRWSTRTSGDMKMSRDFQWQYQMHEIDWKKSMAIKINDQWQMWL